MKMKNTKNRFWIWNY